MKYYYVDSDKSKPNKMTDNTLLFQPIRHIHRRNLESPFFQWVRGTRNINDVSETPRSRKCL